MPSNPPLTIVIPVYNEGANFRALWGELSSGIKTPFTAIVVYDFDEDNTVPVAREIIASGGTRIRLVKNAYGRGVTNAIKTGLEAVESGPVLVTMADLSDELTTVDRMYDLYQQGYDLVCGSRYMSGGRLIGGPFLKQLMSRVSGLTLHYFRGVPTHDATNAFKLYDAAMVHELKVESVAGFELGLELTVKAFLNGYRIAEIPSVWRDRTAGASRFRIMHWLPHYLKWYFFAFQPRRVYSRPARNDAAVKQAE
ncbi:MAG TPA: glycosyltransferase [Terriglobales bacterium]|jgi:glycosyltransferase involved in cell wall biosynthesis|nr:glycosyltransferase [Terriglobales bacterium]